MYSPIAHKNPLLRCIKLLFSPVKVFTYCKDGFDLDAHTGERIALPYAYYSPLTYLLYVLAGIGIALVVHMLPYLEGLVCVVLFLVFHYVISVVILGCFTWEPVDPSIQSMRDVGRIAEKNTIIKAACEAIGLISTYVLLFLA